MTDFNRGTGTTGTMMIRDTGSSVEFWINAGQSATFVGQLGWSGTVNGVGVGGTTQYPSGNPWIQLGAWGVSTSQTVYFHLNATGTQGLGGPTDHSAYIARATIPGQPGTPTASNILTDQMQLNWTIPGNGGAAIDQMLLRRSQSPDMSSYTDFPQPGNSTGFVVTGLTPATTYYWQVFAHNAVGYGPGSGVLTQATLPATPPGLTVASSPSGTSATLTLTAPSGVSGVTSYSIERRIPPSTNATPLTTPSSPFEVTGLTPGTTYEWRASAWIGSYQSPWTNWTSLTQANPNTNPGNYFDGNTTPGADVTFGWTGTANLSTSTQNGLAVTGWMPFSNGVGSSGATGAVMRATGGYAGAYAARVVFFSDATAAGFRAGTAIVNPGLADVAGNATYWGSIYVNLPSRDQRLAAEIVFFTAAGTPVGTATSGVSTLVAAGAWTRLSVIATSPASAEWAAVRVVDVTGAGWATWKGGDIMLLDAAMVSLGELFTYFDGSFPDTGGFIFSWTGTANASASTREQDLSSVVDPLIDPDCAVIPAPPRPPSVPSDCIEEIGVWRRYWASIPASEVSDWLTVLPTLEIQTGSVAARQVRVRVYPNPFGYSIGLVDTTEWCSEQIISYIPPNTILTINGMTQRVWAEVAGGGALNADHLLYGTGGTPAIWPELSCGISYLVSFDVPLDAPEGNITPRVFLTQRT